MITILNETELRALVPLSLAAVDTIENAFRSLADGGVVMPPVLSMAFEDVNGEVDIKTAYIPGLDVFAIKVSPGFFDNPKVGLPSLNGMMMALSSSTGLVEAVLLDNGHLTNIRTAAAGAVAARWLAPNHVRTVTVMGAGVQARLQAIAAHLVRPFTEIFVWALDFEEARRCAADIQAATGAQASAVSDPAAAVADSQLVITTTPAREPIFRSEWLHPGLHITCMGSDQETKNEIAPEVLVGADLYVCDRVAQCERLGELRSARQKGLLTGIVPPELGELVSGKRMGRKSDDQITICDLTGTGVQDTAIANLALKLSSQRRIGHQIAR